MKRRTRRGWPFRCAAARDSPSAPFTSLVNRLRPSTRPYSSMSWRTSSSSLSKSNVTAKADWGTSEFSVSVDGSSKRSSTAQWTPSRRCSAISRSYPVIAWLPPSRRAPDGRTATWRAGRAAARRGGRACCRSGPPPRRPARRRAPRCGETPPPARAGRRGGGAPARPRRVDAAVTVRPDHRCAVTATARSPDVVRTRAVGATHDRSRSRRSARSRSARVHHGGTCVPPNATRPSTAEHPSSQASSSRSAGSGAAVLPGGPNDAPPPASPTVRSRRPDASGRTSVAASTRRRSARRSPTAATSPCQVIVSRSGSGRAPARGRSARHRPRSPPPGRSSNVGTVATGVTPPSGRPRGR